LHWTGNAAINKKERRGCYMKKTLMISILAWFLVLFGNACHAGKSTDEKPGEALFKQNCAVCHPDGGNIINPAFTLHKKDLNEHNITKPEQIVDKMRNPGPGMTKFDETTISDKDAEKIAKYVLETFK
jgi:cytochrome c6